ncbi:MAG: methionyl-tRNA formyltransferase [Rothia sp. (in: high G+C Gram-positive bacteria)]|uniref:methionyl-tRNA formyltransferase n=1 Tax=Rothia sp. (in: high G+C Gram-positive bacteria) TaxID=1885016 RepID=UPI0026E0A8F8|nr:methionyl-tRNA formyltransferase [Rothia sp. (in: high G+C Gram-positive bacteria)]MDO5750988.1 methionyl-tRNA formyltransferase [Rothia sp. (in: high G+C Gram-positive bacteria)]
MKIVYAGTPDVAVPPLRFLAETEGVEVVAVLTREDAPLGRKRVLTPSPVAAAAQELGIPVVKASRWSEDVAQQLASFGAQAAAVVAYGALLPQTALDLLPLGWVNLHFSALPAWRGAAPVQRALMAGEQTIHANTFLLEAGLDTGPVFEQDSTEVRADDTADSILERLAYEVGGAMLLRTFERLAAGEPGTVQTEDDSVSYAAKMSIEDGKLDFAEPAQAIVARYRGVTSEPGAWCTYRENRFKIGELAPVDPALAAELALAPGVVTLHAKKVFVGTGAVDGAPGAVQLLRVQPASKKMMAAADWARGTGKDLAEGAVVLV